MKIKHLLLSLLLFSSACLARAQIYNPDPHSLSGTKFNDEVHAMKIDGNGKIIAGGDFTDFNGTTRNYLARLNADGSIDSDYNPSPLGSVSEIALHADNAITVLSSSVLRRYDDSGTEFGIGEFAPSPPSGGPINVVASESTGYDIILGGVFTGGIAKMLADGSLDATFASNIGSGFNVDFSAGRQVRSVEITSTGQILVGGDFTSFDGTTRNHIALLNSDGTLDTSFDPGTVLANDLNGVYALAMQEDGKVVAGSNPSGLTRVVRFNTDGSLDKSFGIAVGSSLVRAIHIDGTEAIMVGGWFSAGIAKLDYTMENAAQVSAGNGLYGGDLEVNTMVAQSDGTLYIAGDFSGYNGFISSNYAELITCHITLDEQPNNITVCEGGNATFTVEASGGSQYQWQINTNNGVGFYAAVNEDTPYSGSLSSSLNISSTTSDMNNYKYRCVVIDSDNSLPRDCYSITEASTLTVHSNATITSHPESTESCTDSGVTFQIEYTGDLHGFNWQVNDGNGFVDIDDSNTEDAYSNVTGSQLQISTPSTDLSGYQYRLRAGSCEPFTFSNAATLTVHDSPVISNKDEVNIDYICETGNSTFSVEASGPGIAYQWQYRSSSNPLVFTNLNDNEHYSGSQTTTLNIADIDNTVPELIGGTIAYYRCIVSTDQGCINATNNSFGRVEVYSTPTITEQPINMMACNEGSGASASATVLVDSNPAGYQWQVDEGSGFVDLVDNEIYSGTQSYKLQLDGATTAMNGLEYRCIVGNCSSSVISDVITLLANDIFTITTQPSQITYTCEDGDPEISVVTDGTDLSYQWQIFQSGIVPIEDNETYSGTTNPNLLLSNVSNDMDGTWYECVITNGGCTLTSSRSNLRVNTFPNMNEQPQKNTTCEGLTAILRAGTGNTNLVPPYTYQWQEAPAGSENFIDISDGSDFYGTDRNVLNIISPTSEKNGNHYRLLIKGCESDLISNTATLTVTPTPVISESPTAQISCAGEATTFTVQAIGDNIRYQWFMNDGNGYEAMTSYQSDPEYVISNTPASYNGNVFKCVISAPSPCHLLLTTESAEVTLTVNEVDFSVQPQSTTTCWGDEASFTVTTTGSDIKYQWLQNGQELEESDVYTGTQSNMLLINPATTDQNGAYYQCTITGLCELKTSNAAYLGIYGGDKPIISASGTYLSTDYIVSGYDTFEWSLDGTVIHPFANNPSIAADQPGSYTVVRESSGCISDASDPYVVENIITSVDPMSASFSIYPNPATHTFRVSLVQMRHASIELLSFDGRVLKKIEKSQDNNINIDISDLHPGVYLFRVSDKETEYLRKVIIK